MISRTITRAATVAFASILLLAQADAAAANGTLLDRSRIVLPNAEAVDAEAQTVVLPLHRGRAGSETVWYVVTDSSDKADAARRGAVYAPLLSSVGDGCSACVQHVRENGTTLVFNGAPDFSKTRVFVPGATGFPPKSAMLARRPPRRTRRSCA